LTLHQDLNLKRSTFADTEKTDDAFYKGQKKRKGAVAFNLIIRIFKD